MGDPLSLLKDFMSENKEIIDDEDKFIFGDLAFSKTVETNFLVYGSGKGERGKEYYTLEALKYFLDNLNMQHTQYLHRASAAKIQLVTRVDRSILLDYLRGKTLNCSSIDTEGPLEFPIPAPKRFKLDRLQDLGQNPCTSSATSRQPGTTPCQINCLNKMDDIPRDPRLARKRDKHSSTFIDNSVATLTEAIGIEKMAELKAKREFVKKGNAGRSSVSSTLEGMEKMAALKVGIRPIMSKEQAATLDLMSQETNFETRNTILQSNRTEFLGGTMRILHELKVKSERMTKFGSSSKVSATPCSSATPSASYRSTLMDRPSVSGYNRYDQECHVGDDEIEEFHIDPLKTFSTNFVGGVQETLKSKPILNKPKQVIKPVAPKRKKTSHTPIIIVPGMPPSLVTMLNAKDILQDLQFVSHEERKAGFTKPRNEMLIYRNRGDGCIPYNLVDLPEKLSMQDWDRVVAMFVTGKSWQFKGWPWNGNPVEVCSKICALHLKFDDVDLDSNVKQWNVNVVQISRHRRHLDKAAFLEFWKKIDEHIITHKSYLRY